MISKHGLKIKIITLTIIPIIAMLTLSVYYIHQIDATNEIVHEIASDNSLIPDKNNIKARSRNYANLATSSLRKYLARGEEIEDSSLINITLFSIFTLIVAFIANTIISKNLINSIKRAATIANRISNGERHVEINIKSEDEIGQLKNALFNMQESILTTEKMLHASHHEIELITDNVSVMICRVNKNKNFVFTNKTYAEFHRYAKKMLRGKTVKEVVGIEEYSKIKPYIEKVLKGEEVKFERAIIQNGKTYYLAAHYLPDFNKDHEVIGYIGVQYDITELKNKELLLEKQRTELELLSTIDALTGVKNRRYLSDKIDEQIYNAKRYQIPFSILMLDLDHFKQINDTYGHAIGDDVLRIVGKILNFNVRENDIVTRYGGEEFNILLPHTDTKDAAVVAERLRAVIEEAYIPIDAQNRVDFTCSIGIAEYHDAIRNGETLLALADDALYRAKKQGRNQVVSADELLESSHKKEISQAKYS